ncbi:MAG: hypothetical protein QM728_04380 [Gordonia sp. (in: high G+C Gram-positive bacteria)]|uniref:hypothetical protein n=1 Tax=Gordonia sp. (in: high G+C Gram-positive bacteria) TaxID=84139 RepID=UPI0039E6F553
MAETTSPRSAWTGATALGHRGEIARGRTVLDDLEAALEHSGAVDDRALASLAQSTRGSWLRQSGRHRLALGRDGVAVYRAVDAGGPFPRHPWLRAALADGLIGLAADCLGLGRFDGSTRMLERAVELLDATPDPDDWWTGSRVRLRHRWVTAENALYRGDADTARREAAAAVASARDCPSPHHRIKTDLIAAAASAAAGDPAGAAASARDVVDEARSEALVPLEWAGWQLLAGLAPGTEADRCVAEAAERLTASGFFA